MFKEGDKVVSLMYGLGRVDEVTNDPMYPIVVEFEHCEAYYLADGRIDDGAIRPDIYKVEK